MIDLNQDRILLIGDATPTLLQLEDQLRGWGADTQRISMVEEELPGDFTAAVLGPNYFRHEDFMSRHPEEIESAFLHNFEQPTFALQRVARQMKAGGIRGSIVVLSSIVALEPHSRTNLTGSSLAALEVIVRMAAVDLGPDGIRINLVAGGWIDSERAAPLVDHDGQFRHSTDIPLRSRGTTNDLANACVYLISALSQHLTGTIMRVDGGYSLTKSAFQTPYHE